MEPVRKQEKIVVPPPRQPQPHEPPPQEERRPAWKVRADAPYPAVKVSGKDPQLAQALKGDAFGPKNELTSVSQYLYQSWMLRESHPEESMVMKEIAVTEMRHLELLGEFALALGGNPTFSSAQHGRVVPWSGATAAYDRMLPGMMQDDIVLEQGAIDLYERQASRLGDGETAKLLRRIVEDERLHLEIFRKFLARSA